MNLPSRFVRRTLGLALTLVLAVVVHAADSAKKSFDVPAGSAGETLKIFAAQAGREIVFAAATVGDRATNAVRGELSTTEALDRLLAGSDLAATQDAKTGAIAVPPHDPFARPKRDGAR